jgi:hypothetical protein
MNVGIDQAGDHRSRTEVDDFCIRPGKLPHPVTAAGRRNAVAGDGERLVDR